MVGCWADEHLCLQTILRSADESKPLPLALVSTVPVWVEVGCRMDSFDSSECWPISRTKLGSYPAVMDEHGEVLWWFLALISGTKSGDRMLTTSSVPVVLSGVLSHFLAISSSI